MTSGRVVKDPVPLRIVGSTSVSADGPDSHTTLLESQSLSKRTFGFRLRHHYALDAPAPSHFVHRCGWASTRVVRGSRMESGYGRIDSDDLTALDAPRIHGTVFAFPMCASVLDRLVACRIVRLGYALGRTRSSVRGRLGRRERRLDR